MVIEKLADLFGLTVDETADLLKTEVGRRTLGLSDSVPVETQIRLLLRNVDGV